MRETWSPSDNTLLDEEALAEALGDNLKGLNDPLNALREDLKLETVEGLISYLRSSINQYGNIQFETRHPLMQAKFKHTEPDPDYSGVISVCICDPQDVFESLREYQRNYREEMLAILEDVKSKEEAEDAEEVMNLAA